MIKFKYPCFVCIKDEKERQELIEWLEMVGYRIAHCFVWEDVILVENNHIQTLTTDDVFLFPDKAIDCGQDIGLFKSIAAINDENDYMQYFISKGAARNKHGVPYESNITYGCREWYERLNEFYLSLENKFNKKRYQCLLWEKANPNELIDYFKTNKK